MKTETLNIPALFFYGLLCGALAVVFMISFRHFESFYRPEFVARPKYVQTPVKQKNLEKLNPKSVTFSYDAPSAQAVQLVGDFNAWGAYPLNLNKDDNNAFTLKLALPKGKYKYRFLIDGQNAFDEKAPQITFNGEVFNILEVK